MNSKRPPRRRYPIALCAVAAALAWASACSDDRAGDADDSSATTGGGAAGGGEGGGATGGGQGGDATGAGGATTGTGGSASSGGAGGGSSAVCGDGVTEAPEACDDGNQDAGDYCAADCMQVTGACGDGVQQTNETCDDGVIMSGCDTLTDGGDGACVPPGTCSPGYIFVQGDGCVPEVDQAHVHIQVDNFCNMTVMPMEYTVPPGQRLKLSYHNHSVDYPVDVWLSYGGGYLDLATGATWNDQFEHCSGPGPYQAYADISTACSSFQLQIHCL